MIGKNKGSKKGGPRKKQVSDFSKWKRNELEKVARRYFEITKNKNKNEKDNESASLNLSMVKIAKILEVSRSDLPHKNKEIANETLELKK